ncbi:hypothetical protein CY34DRAFT_772271 [Suillus luteus UH-Slu-Lm8-n1]|uniref:Uncharacterized protein n=1 Tax=Suillus luteus UH-Slu-Lm8-n1 TaxID=930992 RepID=A0A0D0BU32_9AGAM|nr:hypothetical protein CY34DRAFT_772271 [Suillus luteus UH-Slu-Lm8-n1]
MISGFEDKIARQWDLKVGKEIEEARGVCEGDVCAVAVSRNGRWVATGGGYDDRRELRACEVETGIVKTFKGHSRRIYCIDISADNMLLASGSDDQTPRIWNLGSGKLVAGPFKSGHGERIRYISYFPDSQRMISGSSDKTARQWDVKAGEESKEAQNVCEEEVWAVAVSRDG